MVSWLSGANLISITNLGLNLNVTAEDMILNQGSSPLDLFSLNLVNSETIYWKLLILRLFRESIFLFLRPRFFETTNFQNERDQDFPETAILDFSRTRLDKNCWDWDFFETVAELWPMKLTQPLLELGHGLSLATNN